MKIVHVCLNSFFTDGWNYQENMLSKFHALDRHEVSLITSCWMRDSNNSIIRDSRDKYINVDYVHVYRLKMSGTDKPYKKFKKFKGLYPLLESLAPDIIFIHGVGYRDLATVAKFLKNHRETRAYADNHADFSNSATNWVSRRILHGVIWRYYERKLIPYVTKFYGVLPARVDFLSKVYGIPKDKCELLVMGADDSLVEKASQPSVISEIREKYGIKEDDFLIMTGGKIDLFKTQTLLLMEAVSKMENDRIKLIVFGSVVDQLKEKLEKLTDGKRIQYIGWIRAEESYKYFAASDLVVFPGRHSVFWEQVVAQGIPMVVKDWEGTHHVDLGGNIEYIKNDSVNDIKEIIDRIISDESLYKSMKKVAQNEGMKSFSYREISRKAIGVGE